MTAAMLLPLQHTFQQEWNMMQTETVTWGQVSAVGPGVGQAAGPGAGL